MAPVLPAKAADPHTPTTMAAVAAPSSARRPFAVMRLADSGVTTNATITRHTFASHDGSEEMFVPFIPGNKSSVFQEQYTQAHMRPNEQYRMYFATVPLRPRPSRAPRPALLPPPEQQRSTSRLVPCAASTARALSTLRASPKRFRFAKHTQVHYTRAHPLPPPQSSQTSVCHPPPSEQRPLAPSPAPSEAAQGTQTSVFGREKRGT